MTTTEATILEAALDRYGLEAQIRQLAEECGELVAAVNQHHRGRVPVTQIAQEIADVRIMLEQMELNYELAAEVAFWRAEKIKRLAERLGMEVR